MNSMKNGRFSETDGNIRPVSCGFSGIYSNSIDDAAMYVATDQVRQYLVLMPLTPNFYWTAFRLLHRPTFQRIWLVMPNMDQRMISDMINLYMNFESQKYEMHIVYPEPVQDSIGWSPYAATLLRSQCAGADTRILGLDLSIHFRSLGSAAPAGRYGVELISNHGRHLFLNEVTSARSSELLDNIVSSDMERAYTWISMPYRYPTYGGISTYDIVYGSAYLKDGAYAKFREQFKGRMVPYGFTCPEELQEAKEKSVNGAPYLNIPARIVL